MIRIGVFTDAHYARSVTVGTRYCDRSLDKMAAAFATFRAQGIRHVVNLGDLINGDHGDQPAVVDRANIAAVHALWAVYPAVVHHVFGNHDLETLSKGDFAQAVALPVGGSACGYSRCIELSRDAASGDEYARGNYDWTDSALPPAGVAWLTALLTDGFAGVTLVCTHQNLDHRLMNGATDPNLVANAAAVRRILEAATGRVVVLQGHYHAGCYQRINGVDYVTLRALCEGAGPHDNAYAVVSIDHYGGGDRQELRVDGFAAQPSYLLPSTTR